MMPVPPLPAVFILTLGGEASGAPGAHAAREVIDFCIAGDQRDFGGYDAALAHFADQNQVAVFGLAFQRFAKKINTVERNQFCLRNMASHPLFWLAHVNDLRALGDEFLCLLRGDVLKGEAGFFVFILHAAASFSVLFSGGWLVDLLLQWFLVLLFQKEPAKKRQTDDIFIAYKRELKQSLFFEIPKVIRDEMVLPQHAAEVTFGEIAPLL